MTTYDERLVLEKAARLAQAARYRAVLGQVVTELEAITGKAWTIELPENDERDWMLYGTLTMRAAGGVIAAQISIYTRLGYGSTAGKYDAARIAYRRITAAAGAAIEARKLEEAGKSQVNIYPRDRLAGNPDITIESNGTVRLDRISGLTVYQAERVIELLAEIKAGTNQAAA